MQSIYRQVDAPEEDKPRGVTACHTYTAVVAPAHRHVKYSLCSVVEGGERAEHEVHLLDTGQYVGALKCSETDTLFFRHSHCLASVCQSN